MDESDPLVSYTPVPTIYIGAVLFSVQHYVSYGTN